MSYDLHIIGPGAHLGYKSKVLKQINVIGRDVDANKRETGEAFDEGGSL